MGQVLIAGCGFVGTQAALMAVRGGRAVAGLRRRIEALPPEVTGVAADLATGVGMGEIPAAVDTVLYAASPDGGSEEAYRRAYLEGPARLARHFREKGQVVNRWVLLSSTGVYGDRDGAWVDEDTPPNPDTPSGRILEEAETAFLETWGDRGVVLRLGGIYGPGRTRIIEMVADGTARCPQGVPVYSNRIHRDDAARAALLLLDHPSPQGLYLGVDEEPASLCDVYRWLARRLEVDEPEAAPLDRRRSNKRCSSRRLRDAGFSFTFPTFREGYGALLQEMGR